MNDAVKPYFVGISGGSGSGKTTLLKRIVERFNQEALTLISQDNYYISLADLPRDLKGEVNFDHPSALDLDALAVDMEKLQRGESFELEEYTFNNPSRVPKMLRFASAPIVVIEGLFVFNNPIVNEILDLKVFVDTSEHLRLSRRIRRDAAERGYGLEDVLAYYEKFVVPMYRQHIEPFRAECDLVIPNDRHMERATSVLIDHLDAVLARRRA
ncbi:MAG: uridine kinase [Bacteroidetes bacterium]|nr:uridine kinase [Bacteroidota bacterium]